MQQESASRLPALSGAMFFALLFASGLFKPSGLDLASASAEAIRQYYLAHQQSIRAFPLLVGLAYASFVWFLATLVSHLRRAEGAEGSMSFLWWILLTSIVLAVRRGSPPALIAQSAFAEGAGNHEKD